MLKQTRFHAEARPVPPVQQATTICAGCAYRYDFSHDCMSHEVERVESPIGLMVITQCSGFVPAATETAVAQ